MTAKEYLSFKKVLENPRTTVINNLMDHHMRYGARLSDADLNYILGEQPDDAEYDPRQHLNWEQVMDLGIVGLKTAWERVRLLISDTDYDSVVSHFIEGWLNRSWTPSQYHSSSDMERDLKFVNSLEKKLGSFSSANQDEQIDGYHKNVRLLLQSIHLLQEIRIRLVNNGYTYAPLSGIAHCIRGAAEACGIDLGERLCVAGETDKLVIGEVPALMTIAEFRNRFSALFAFRGSPVKDALTAELEW